MGADVVAGRVAGLAMGMIGLAGTYLLGARHTQIAGWVLVNLLRQERPPALTLARFSAAMLAWQMAFSLCGLPLFCVIAWDAWRRAEGTLVTAKSFLWLNSGVFVVAYVWAGVVILRETGRL